MIIAIHATTIKEYIALAPNTNGGTSKYNKLEWVSAEYASDVSNANDVKLEKLTEGVPEIGAWFDLEPEVGLALSGRIVGDTFYALHDIHGISTGGGCCADTLRMYPKDGSAYKDIYLDPIVQEVTISQDAHVSHVVDVSVLNGSMVAFMQVLYTKESLGYAPVNAIVAVDVEKGEVILTADGAKLVDLFTDVGTLVRMPYYTRFKVGYYDQTGQPSHPDEWHANGILHFQLKDGTSLLAYTHRAQSEAVIMKSPYVYTTEEGGGTILQRFGNPWKNAYLQTEDRYFGLNVTLSPFSFGVHNVWYTSDSQALDGAESLSLFVNTQDGYSAAYEFVIRLVEEGSANDTGYDNTFDTKYVYAACDFNAIAQGGARAVGNGVFFVMSGSDKTGLEVVDVNERRQSMSYTEGANLFDPFIRVIATTEEKTFAQDVMEEEEELSIKTKLENSDEEENKGFMQDNENQDDQQKSQ